ncbi:MAG: flavodoxin family protein [Anaerolineae bacterium]
MTALVIYDSVFGNTAQVAQAVGAALGARAVKAAEASQADLQGVDLLVVGSPTRGFQPMPTVKAFLKGLPDGALKGVRTAAFDTHFSDENMKKAPGILKVAVRLFGNSAANHIAKSLTAKGAAVVSQEWFGVETSEGPLSPGELERAGEWAKTLQG